MPLRGKNIVLTGGAGGMGRLMAAELTALGASLLIVDRIDTPPADAAYLKGDLSSFEGIGEVAAALRARACDILINLAGIQYFGPFVDQDPAHVQACSMVNLVAPVLLSQAVLPRMMQGKTGQIVNIGSIFGSINYAHFVTYSSTKAGLKGFSEALRREVGSHGIAVTYIAPRAVKTPLNNSDIMRFAAATKMKLDEPATVVRRIVEAIRARKKDVYIGFPESLFVRVNAVLPRIVDAALASDNRKAGDLFHLTSTAEHGRLS
jgi:short-subunit dehydrogenase